MAAKVLSSTQIELYGCKVRLTSAGILQISQLYVIAEARKYA